MKIQKIERKKESEAYREMEKLCSIKLNALLMDTFMFSLP